MILKDVKQRCDEMESRCNEVWQSLDTFQDDVSQLREEVKDIKTSMIVLMKLLNNFIDHKD